jgi:transposase
LEEATLQAMYRHHPNHYTRLRAHSILLSAQGRSVFDIADILNVHRQSVASWIHAWEEDGICGLIENRRPGRPKTVADEAVEQVLEMVKTEPRSLKRTLVMLEERLGEKLHLKTLKRLCKRAGWCWKRVRKSLRAFRDEAEVARVLEQLQALRQQAQAGEIDLYYFDESGFSLTPTIPYAWQPSGATLELPSQRSSQLNVAGFMSATCQFESFVFDRSINSSIVCACFDAFAQTLRKKTYVLVDNAPVHRSAEFQANIARWEKQNLVVIYNAPYAPELNLIEILWKKIKYEWMPFSAYQSKADLERSLFDILKGVGSQYTINFSSA